MLALEEVEKLADLSRIKLGKTEAEKFQKELSAVLDYVEELKNVNVEGLSEASEVTGLVNVTREDSPESLAEPSLLLAQAPEIKDGYFKVKSIL